MYLKIHQTKEGKVVAICDEELIGKVLEDKEACMDLDKYRKFYVGKKAADLEVKKALEEFDSINAVGKESVGIVLKSGLVKTTDVMYINQIPYIQIYKVHIRDEKGGYVKSITIIADDKVGLLADISYVLAKSKINIDTINVDVVGGKAIISLGLSDAEKGKTVVEAAGYKVEDQNGVVLKLPDKPGELNRITSLLAKEGVSIHHVHILSKDGANTVLSLVVDKPKRAALVLKPHLITNESSY
jgi:hypothetical protein